MYSGDQVMLGIEPQPSSYKACSQFIRSLSYLFGPLMTFLIFVCFGGHTPLFSGSTSGSVLREDRVQETM